jgi:hypothetical protein
MRAAPRPSLLFWIVAVLALLWELFGVAMFWQTLVMSPDAVAALPDAQRQITLARPGWTFLPFGIGTIAGVLGAVGLLLRNRWAAPLLLLSVLCIGVLFTALYAATPAWALMGARGALLPVVLGLAGLFLWGYAARAATRGWLR